MGRTVSLVLLVCLLAGCAGSSALPTTRLQATPGAYNITNLPVPSLLGKLAAASASVNGADYITAVPPLHVAVDGTAAVYSPNYIGDGSVVNDLAMAFYTIVTDGFDEGLMVNLTWTTAPAAEDIWLAAADYKHDAWHWHRAKTDGSIAVSDRARYTLADGTFPVIIAIGGTTECRLEQITVEDYGLPVADLTSDPAPASGNPPFAVNFDASGSASPNGAIVDYQWDLDGNGSFGEHQKPEGAYSGAATAAFTYNLTLLTTAKVRVTDELGFIAEAGAGIDPQSSPITAADIEPLLGAGEILRNVVPLEVEGLPALFITAQLDGFWEGRLLYTRATSTNPYTWGPVVELHNEAGRFPGLFANAEIIDGKPAVAYKIGGGAGGLGYVSARDSLGVSWNAPVEAMANGDPFSLALINGKPALAGFVTSYSTRGIYYVAADDVAGTSWSAPVLIEAQIPLFGQWGERTGLAEVDGKPAVAFRAVDEDTEPDTHQLRFCLAEDTVGSAWGTGVVIDSEEITNVNLNLGEDIFLQWQDSTIGVGYSRIRRSTMGLLMEGDAYESHALDPAGTAWSTPVNIADGTEKTVSELPDDGVISDWGSKLYGISLDPMSGRDYDVDAFLIEKANGDLVLYLKTSTNMKGLFELGELLAEGSFQIGPLESAMIDSLQIIAEKSPLGPPYFVQLRAVVYIEYYEGDDVRVRKFTWPLQSFYSNE